MTAANYKYILDLARRLSHVEKPKVLDFGCGCGQVVEYGRAQGFDICGADTFEGTYENWHGTATEKLSGHVHKIENGRLPFEDHSFDMVLSNYVFEHIKDYAQSLREIHRVLKPGGQMVALFPVHETWYEGHVGVYFPHYLARWPRLQRAYLEFCCRLGLSFNRKNYTPSEWARSRHEVLNTICFYHPRRKIEGDMKSVWGRAPEYHMHDYISWRLRNSAKLAPLARVFSKPMLKPVSEAFCLRRGGVVLSLAKAA